MSHPITRGISSRPIGWSISTVQQVLVKSDGTRHGTNHGTMPQKEPASKKQQDKRVRKEIATKIALRDESSKFEKESNTPSGSVENYDINIDENNESRTTRA
ncbi:hypothetical protein HAX54_051381 [Datura stramonium]|uniref:Uncharacterized protein n=1 Tax=Datura stramonium TaxID=4076 RepID=A0ABS8SXK5_DATST|nr:hypothetical protein [Datura stramonium]